jgi:hypothetical protein
MENLQRAADLLCQQAGDFAVARNGLAPSGAWIPADRVRSAFAPKRPAMLFPMPDESVAFQASLRQSVPHFPPSVLTPIFHEQQHGFAETLEAFPIRAPDERRMKKPHPIPPVIRHFHPCTT